MAISIIRTLILYIVMVVSMRVMGKRQLGELEPYELVVAILISDLAANPLQDLGTPLAYGLVPVMTLLFCEIMMSAAVLKFRSLRRIVSGTASVLIQNGKLDRAEMKKNRFTVDELLEHLRKSGIVDISTVKFAILETDGTLSTILYDTDSPATPKQHNLKVSESEMPLLLISDGEVVTSCLHKLGFNENWLEKQLRDNGFGSVNDIFIMMSDKSGNVYISPKEPA